jgi:hypothetical protein
LFDEITDIGTYSTIMTSIKEIVAFGKNIPTGLCFVFGTIATERAREVPQVGILLLEITQARRNQLYIFGFDRN